MLLWASGDHDSAAREGKAAIDLNPNSFWSQMSLGLAFGFSGPDDYETAMKHLKLAIRLGPRDVNINWTYAVMAATSLVSEKYGDTIDYASTAIRHDPTNGTANRLLAAALALEGQIEAAKAAWVTAWEVQPLDLLAYVDSMHRMFKRDEDAERFIQGMRLAGAPFE